MVGDCVQSKNHPQSYGNNEECSLELYDVPISFDAFSTESGYDILFMGAQYSGTSSPPSGSYTGSVSWSSDYSVVSTGWKMCRQDSSPSPAPTTPSPTPAPTTPSPTPAPTTPTPPTPTPPSPTPPTP